ncbi:DUF6318 family protein [Georgenia sp. 10Sc9-8]|uniref:DUF6318 family protein n=1 Tax=Georgenia halotolerans TaxID=3028317 RepID=A0ABT5TZS1_9MICO|nr:DUF6318 family protein [Georgenia halotolerans]
MRTARSTAAVVAGALLLAGCGSEAQPPPTEPPPDPATTSTPADEAGDQASDTADEPTEASSPDDAVPDRPVMDPPPRPEAMDDDGTAGAEAAAEYFISLYPYVYATGDLTEWRELSDPECVFCTSVIENVEELHDEGGYQVGGEISVRGVSSRSREPGNQYFRVDLRISEAPSTRVASSGKSSRENGGNGRLIFALAPEADGWRVREGQVEDVDANE